MAAPHRDLFLEVAGRGVGTPDEIFEGVPEEELVTAADTLVEAEVAGDGGVEAEPLDVRHLAAVAVQVGEAEFDIVDRPAPLVLVGALAHVPVDLVGIPRDRGVGTVGLEGLGQEDHVAAHQLDRDGVASASRVGDVAGLAEGEIFIAVRLDRRGGGAAVDADNRRLVGHGSRGRVAVLVVVVVRDVGNLDREERGHRIGVGIRIRISIRVGVAFGAGVAAARGAGGEEEDHEGHQRGPQEDDGARHG